MSKIKLIIFFLLTYSGFSQTILKGTVKDSLQMPLSFANVIAKPQDSVSNLKFSITDESGYYELELKKGSYIISVSYLGFDTFSFKYSSIKNRTQNIILKAQKTRLEEVLIKLPVTVKQDTITYNIEKFVTGSERKLKNVLNKLPGIEVDKKGNIKVQGKEVTTMLVEGKDFFGGGSKLAVNNIPANAIDKIEVIDNYNKILFLKNLSDSNEMAINIKLKENKKQFTFGDIEAGKGNKDFYRVHSNLFYYSSKTNLNFIGNLNNTSEKTFTLEDYLNFQGGINAVFKRGNSIFKESNNDFAQFLENKDLTSSKNKFGALNITQEVNNKLNISGYSIFSYSKDKMINQSINQYNTFNEVKSTTGSTKNILGIGKLTFNYTPNLKEQWYFNSQIKKTNNFIYNTINSNINTTNSTFLTNKELQATYFNQNIEWHKRASKNHTYSFVADFTFDKNNPLTFWKSNNPILQDLIPVMNQPIYKLKQLKETISNNFDTLFKHYWILNRNNHIYSTFGNTYLTQSFFTDDSQELENGTINSFSNSGFGNNLNFKLNDLFLGFHYKFRTGIFTFKQGFFLHSYKWNIIQSIKTKSNKLVILPDFLTKIEFENSKKIQFNYNLNTSFSDASNFTNQFYIQSYNSVFKGNETLENELYHSLRMRYNQFKTYRGISIYANINYTKKVRGITNTVNYQGINQYLSPLLIKNQDEKWSFRGNLKKKIKDIKFSLGFNFMTAKYLQKTNNVFETNKNNTTSLKISAKTLYDNFPTIEIGYNRNISNYTLSNSTSKFITNEPFINIDYDFLNRFIFNFEYTKYNYENNTLKLKNTYEIANTIISYKKENSAWSYKITGSNLFNTRFKQSNSFSTYLISNNKTFILPRVVVFSIVYNL